MVAHVDVDGPERRCPGAVAVADAVECSLGAVDQRSFGLAPPVCAQCGGHLRLIANIETATVVRRILAHLGLPTQVPAACPHERRRWISVMAIVAATVVVSPESRRELGRFGAQLHASGSEGPTRVVRPGLPCRPVAVCARSDPWVRLATCARRAPADVVDRV